MYQALCRWDALQISLRSAVILLRPSPKGMHTGSAIKLCITYPNYSIASLVALPYRTGFLIYMKFVKQNTFSSECRYNLQICNKVPEQLQIICISWHLKRERVIRNSYFICTFETHFILVSY